jgi:uncharacterized RDD family membrane protein YckC
MAPRGARAQTPPTVASAEPVASASLVDIVNRRNEVVRVGADYVLRAGEEAGEVAVVLGGATIEGQVHGDAVVVLGPASIASSAVIDGSLIVVGGDVKVMKGAVVNGAFIVIGGGLDQPDGFSPGDEQIHLGLPGLGGRIRAALPWVTRGLLWGRPIVPSLPWIWTVVAALFVAYLVLNLAFERPIRACAERLEEKPLSALVAGALVVLLIGPVSLLLMLSIVGVAVVPFLLCAVFVAGILGKIAVARWSGRSILHQDLPDSRFQSARSFAIGFAAIIVAYMIPVLGFSVFALVSLLGLGAAALSFVAGYRRENPAPDPATARPWRAAPPSEPDGGTAVFKEAPAVFAGGEAVSFPRARFRDRLAAFVLDVILVLIVRSFLASDRFGVTILLLLVYHIGFWAWKGTTVGGIICQLRVVRVDGSPLRFVDALVRGLSSIFSLVVAGIGCLWILRDAERQSWHDKIAGTYVVKVPRNYPL